MQYWGMDWRGSPRIYPRTTSVTSVYRDTGVWGSVVVGQSRDYQCYSGVQRYSDSGAVGYAWKDSP